MDIKPGKLGEVVIKIYENDAQFINLPQQPVLQLVMFAYYFDRVIHNFSTKNQLQLIHGFQNISAQFHNSMVIENPPTMETMIETVFFGTKFCEDEGKGNFEAKGEYCKKSEDYFYLNTHFKPVFADNNFMELKAAQSVIGYFDYLLKHLGKMDIIFLLFLIGSITNKYIQNIDNTGSIPPIGQVPAEGLKSAGSYVDSIRSKR